MDRPDFIEELDWRGMIQDKTPEIETALSAGGIPGYIGFDPTASSITIGNYVQIMLLTQYRRAGHRPIALIGGATGLIGDPSGKDAERQLRSRDEIHASVESLQKQINALLEASQIDGPDPLLINNYEFYADMDVFGWLRDVGKHLTINYMLSKDSVQNRIESGISYTEFSYQLLQAYDYVELYKRYGCRVQMGGSDQWGNITAGTELIRRMIQGKGYAITTPLLTKSDGKKFGKSEKGAVWMSPERTSPYSFYQFWINADDADLPTFYKYFSLKSKEEILSINDRITTDPRGAKADLAEEMTRRIHGDASYESVLQVSDILFNPRAKAESLTRLGPSELALIAEEINSPELRRSTIDKSVSLLDLLSSETRICQSKSEARRAITGNAVSINKVKQTDPEYLVTRDNLLHGRYVMIDNGKKNKYLVRVV